MTTHITAITYEPKIEATKNGSIRNTWRILNPKRPKKVRDTLLTHGWSGKPYRSPWNWRRSDEIRQVVEVEVQSEFVRLLRMESIGGIFGKPKDDISGIRGITYEMGAHDYSWDSKRMDYEAKLDGIQPPLGLELKRTLEGFHGRFEATPVHFQIIRW